ncbi:heme o synthase [Oceanobacillus bengalensis]|uniref:Protoheme IX farnesyltransferase n=1 Tax=Oceanobacillus bengalensis TaxID=1435466 RepID=A0A494Z1L6_9BACI|nr:heme o synthase [Oceanobacillus bengalensis]RKQ16338.1 protoheme IX farnesyltransferase [Oceanobacillus bengalensis]
MDKMGTPYTEMLNDTTVSGWQKIKTMMSEVKALIKIGIIHSNLITTFAGFWLAIYFSGASITSNWDKFILTMLGSALVIAGGCIFNNWYDVDIDPKMARTKKRPTVTGFFSLKAVLTMGIITTVIGLILLLLTTVEAAIFGFIGWFVYVVLYTMWSKRKTTLNTAVGSISGAMPPLIGWAAISPTYHIVPIIMFLIMFIWQTPHFLSLAMKKTEDYRSAGVPMLPVVYGFEMTKRQIVIYIICLLPLPFFLTSLGTTFVVIATILNIGWLILGFKGFYVKDDIKWANIIFIYSLNYLTIIFLLMIVVTLPIFS